MVGIRAIALLSAVALAIAAADPALAQSKIQRQGGGQGTPQRQPTGGGLIQGTNPETTARILKQAQDAGYGEVQVITIDNKKQVRAVSNGQPFIVFHACEKDQPDLCRSIQFATTFGQQQSIDLKWVNAWNRDWRFTKMYLDNEGQLIFTMDVHFYGGTSPEYISQSASFFAALLQKAFEFEPSK